MDQASYYRERADRLIGEVKDLFISMQYVEDGQFISPITDILQRLLLVDNVERLGIDRHFINEIKTTLDYVYRYVVLSTAPPLSYSLYIHSNKRQIMLAGRQSLERKRHWMWEREWPYD